MKRLVTWLGILTAATTAFGQAGTNEPHVPEPVAALIANQDNMRGPEIERLEQARLNLEPTVEQMQKLSTAERLNYLSTITEREKELDRRISDVRAGRVLILPPNHSPFTVGRCYAGEMIAYVDQILSPTAAIIRLPENTAAPRTRSRRRGATGGQPAEAAQGAGGNRAVVVNVDTRGWKVNNVVKLEAPMYSDSTAEALGLELPLLQPFDPRQWFPPGE